MEEIGKRLRETSEECLKAYEGWSKARKDIAVRESLMEAVHELRKVAARLEIEIAASEREDITQRTLPIPPHRSSRRGGGEMPEINTEYAGDDDNTGNTAPRDDRPQGGHGHGGGHGGGGQRHGGQRRPMRRQQSE